MFVNRRTTFRLRPVSARRLLKQKNRQKNPEKGILTVYVVAGTGLEPVTFGL